MKNILIICLLVVAMIIGVGIGFYNGAMFKTSGFGSSNFSDGWQAAEEKLMLAGTIPSNLYSLSGEIEKIVGNEIYFKADLNNPLLSEDLKTRIAVVKKDTSIILYKNKEKAVTSAEIEAGMRERMDIAEKRKSLSENSPDCFLAQNSEENISQKCIDLMEQLGKLDEQERFVNESISPYEVIKVEDVSMFKPGMQILVNSKHSQENIIVSERVETKPSDKMEETAPVIQKEDISKMKKFEASSIELREGSKEVDKLVQPVQDSGVVEVAPGKFEVIK
jgi:hypothetical protein